jgi:hypothetical protein
MIGQLALKSNVLIENPDELTIEESHFRPWLLYGIILSFWGGLAGAMYYQTGDLLLFGIAVGVGFFLFVCPYLIVMLFSGYRRFTIKPEKSLEFTWVPDLGKSRVTRIPWAELESVVCHFYPEKVVYHLDEGDRVLPAAIRLVAIAKNKKPLLLLGRPYEELIVEKMRRYFGEKFDFRRERERFSPTREFLKRWRM